MAPQCCKCFRRCKKCVKRNAQVLCSPTKMGTVTTMFLDRWVTRRTFVSFALFEVFICAGAFVFFFWYREIAELGLEYPKSWLSYVMIMCFRGCCGLAGIYGACFRKIKVTRFYFGALAMNMFLTIITAMPFWNCPCVCDEPYRKLSRFESAECKVLAHFNIMDQGANWPEDPQTLMEHFDVTTQGIGWHSDAQRECQAYPSPFSVFSEEESSKTISAIRSLTENLSKGHGLPKGPMSNQGWQWADELEDFLERCLHQDYCGLVEANLAYFTGEDAGPLQSAGYRFSICTHDVPVYPVTMGSQMSTDYDHVFLQKDLMRMPAHIEHGAKDFCHFIVTIVFLALALLDLLSLPMFIIVSKFLARHCGDFLRQERQFPIEFSSEEELSETRDDFSVSRLPSSQATPATSYMLQLPAAAHGGSPLLHTRQGNERMQQPVRSFEVLGTLSAQAKSDLGAESSQASSFVSMRPVQGAGGRTPSRASSTVGSHSAHPENRDDSLCEGADWELMAATRQHSGLSEASSMISIPMAAASGQALSGASTPVMPPSSFAGAGTPVMPSPSNRSGASTPVQDPSADFRW